MGKINFSDVATRQNNSTDSNTNFSNSVGFFKLSNDGEEAIVRFMFDTTDDFEILQVHGINLSGKFRRINCLRDNAKSPIDQCPFCASGIKQDTRIFIHMLQYVQDETGKIVARPVVWERSLAYAYQLKGYIDNYGPLSDIICKIVRHGAPRSQDTRYDIIPNLNKQIYRDDIYVKDIHAFDNYSVLGSMVLDKNADDSRVFIATGEFPVSTTTRTTAPVVSAPVGNTYTPFVPSQPAAPVMTNADMTQTMPWETPAESEVTRPIRRY